MKKLLFTFLSSLCLFSLVGCSSDKELRYAFKDFLLELEETSVQTNEYGVDAVYIELPSGFTCEYGSANQEKDGRRTAIYCTIMDSEWELTEYNDMKQDLEYLCSLFEQYAESIGWLKNDYYLYVDMNSNIDTSMHYTYQQQANLLYVAAAHENLAAICRTFGTTSLEDIAGSPEGKQLLLDYDIAKIEDGELLPTLNSLYILIYDGNIRFLDLTDYTGKVRTVTK